jgi:hypothetical protein
VSINVHGTIDLETAKLRWAIRFRQHRVTDQTPGGERSGASCWPSSGFFRTTRAIIMPN